MELKQRWKVIIARGTTVIGISSSYYNYTDAIAFADRQTYGSQTATVMDSEIADKLVPSQWAKRKGF